MWQRNVWMEILLKQNMRNYLKIVQNKNIKHTLTRSFIHIYSRMRVSIFSSMQRSVHIGWAVFHVVVLLLCDNLIWSCWMVAKACACVGVCVRVQVLFKVFFKKILFATSYRIFKKTKIPRIREAKINLCRFSQ